MEIIYTRAANRNYMNIRVPDTADTAAYPVQILLTGRVPGLLPAALTRVDNLAYLSFDITGYQTLATLCERHLLTFQELRTITGSLLHTLNGLRPYLLDLMQVPLKPEFIFLHWDTNTVRMPYQPFPDPEGAFSLAPLFEYLLSRIDPSDTEALLLCSRLFRASLGPGAAPEELLMLFEKRDAEETAPSFPAAAKSTDRPYAPPPAPVQPSDASGELPPLEEDFFQEKHRDQPAVSPKIRFPNGTGAKTSVKDAAGRVKNLLAKSVPENRRAAGRILFYTVLALFILLLSVTLIRGESAGMERPAAACLLLAALALLLFSILQRKRKKKKTGAQEESRSTGAVSPGVPTRREAASFPVFPEEAPEANPAPPPYYPAAPSAPIRGPELPEETTVLSAHSGTPARLVPVEDNPHKTLFLPEYDVTVGSRPGAADLVIPEPTVSRLHARILYENGIRRITDLNSTNGTEVNGETVVGRTSVPLTDGDRVRIAGLLYVYQEQR